MSILAQRSQETAAPATGDLREWLRKVEAIGELQRIAQPVAPIEEMGALTYMVGKRPGSPALLFERPGGSAGYRSLWNLLGTSTRRIALTLGEPTESSRLDLIGALREKLRRRLAPVELDPKDAPVNERILTGAEIDMTAVPAPKHWPLDGGRYIGTCDAVFTRDPDTGYVNMGTYRMMVHDRDHLGHGADHRQPAGQARQSNA